MSETETTLSPSLSEPSVSLETLQREYQSLRTLFQAVVLALIVLSGGFTIFLLRQVSLLRKQIEANRPMVTQVASDFAKINGPMIQSFLVQLQNFSKTNPDFVPILKKYTSPANPAEQSPAAAQPPAQKK